MQYNGNLTCGYISFWALNEEKIPGYKVVILHDFQLLNIALLSYLENHGFLFKILIQMHLLSTDVAIWIWVFSKIDKNMLLI